MCGLYGWVGKNPTKFNVDKFKILGLYNVDRGTDSCGVSIDADINVGLGKLSSFQDYIENDSGDVVKIPTIIPTVIGHTRRSSFGSHTAANAHPFGFGNSDHGFGFIGAHNGTLLNHKKLANDYKVDITAIESKDGGKTERKKIDSEILFEILYKTKNFKVLSEYNGAAALVWYDANYPNVCYFYHGKSAKYEYDNNAVEERPLFYYQETKNSLYFSSIEESLKTISKDFNKIGSFEYNTIYKVTNGDLKNAIKYKISRASRYQKEFYGNFNYYGHYENHNKYSVNYTKNKKKERKKKKTEITTVSRLNIFNEKPRFTDKEIGGRTYFHKLRWKRNGHLVTGVYTLIPNYGFVYLANSIDMANKEKDTIVGKPFDYKEGIFKDYILTKDSFYFSKEKEIPLIYIWNGIMIRTAFDYNHVQKMNMSGKPFSYKQLSHISMHPVIDVNSYYTSTSQNITKNGKLYTGTFTMMNTSRIYEIKEGNLINIKDIPLDKNFFLNNKKEKITPIIPLLPEKNDCECGDNTCFVCNDPHALEILETIQDADKAENVLVVETIDEIFESALCFLPLGKEQLEKYLPNEKAKNAIKVIDEIMKKTIEL